MPKTTTIRVSTATRDAVKALATADRRTLDEQIALMARRERQRQMGESLSSVQIDDADQAVLDSFARTMRDERR